MPRLQGEGVPLCGSDLVGSLRMALISGIDGEGRHDGSVGGVRLTEPMGTLADEEKK